MTGIRQRAAAVVAAWLSTRQSPRDAMAEDRALHAQPAAVRAAVVALAQAVLTAWRRLEFVLGGAAGLAHLPPLARATALVLAHEVEQAAVSAATAERLFAAASRHRLTFAGLEHIEHCLAGLFDVEERFAVRHSMPDWLARRLLQQHGGEAEAVARALAMAAPRTLRANTLRIASRGELAAALSAVGIGTRATAHAPLGLHVEGSADLFATSVYRSGAFDQQDEASQLAALVTAPPPGGRVLDLCAGTGGKTLALAAAMQNRGEVLATDVHAGRLELLRQRARRAGADNVRALQVQEHVFGEAVTEFARRADRILVDAPCSGTGSWRRRPEARWNLGPGQLDSLVAAQDRLLDNTVGGLRPGARLVYATCSMLDAENEWRVAALCSRWPSLEIVRIAEILGGELARPIADATGTFLTLRPDRHGCDGFFAAVLRRRRHE